MKWWGAQCKTDMRPYFRALPSFIIWSYGEEETRKNIKGKDLSLSRIIHNVTRSMYRLIKVRRPWMNVSGRWEVMIKELEEYCTGMAAKKVKWECPPEGWINKYNTDGASRGNPGLSSSAFFLRDERGDIIHAERVTIENATSTVTEAKMILEASKHCKQRNLNKVIIQNRFDATEKSAYRGMGDTMEHIRCSGGNKDMLGRKTTYFSAHIKGRKSASRSPSKQGN